MNKAIIMGRPTKDPAITYAQGNQLMVARYTLAVDRVGKDKGADFISCVAFGKGAEFAEKYVKKGRKYLVSGRIQTGSYDAKDGHKVYTTDIIVESQEFADAKDSPAAPTAPKKESDSFMAIPDGVDDEGLPFN